MGSSAPLFRPSGLTYPPSSVKHGNVSRKPHLCHAQAVSESYLRFDDRLSVHCGTSAPEYNASPSLQFFGSMFALFLRAFLAITLSLCPVLASAQGLRVVARVNDDAITDFDLNQRITFAIRSSGLQDSPEMRQRLAPQILRQMIDERLQIQNSKGLGLRVTEAELNQRVSEIERSAGMARGQFRQYLQS